MIKHWRAVMLFVAATSMCMPAVGASLSDTQLAKLKRAVTAGFDDPASAEFRNIELVHGASDLVPGEGFYCGEVRPKGAASGAFDGYMPFYLAMFESVRVIDIGTVEFTANHLRDYCRKMKTKS